MEEEMSEAINDNPTKLVGATKRKPSRIKRWAKGSKRNLIRNKFRYLTMIAGFFLFVAPFGLFTRAVDFVSGVSLPADVHTICYRVPLAWLTGGGPYLVESLAASVFAIGIVAIALFFGPLWCGWMCPVGALSEGISRAIPIPERFRLNIRSTRVTAGLRYGFFFGFVVLAALIGYQMITYQFGNVTCRYCASYLMQIGSDMLFGTGPGINILHAGIFLTLFAWLIVGGIFTSGGRGWCLFLCPLGAISSIAHRFGSSAGAYRMNFDEERCRDCKKCTAKCPMWAIGEDHKIERSLCIGCRECSKACVGKAYAYGRGNGKQK